MRDAKRDVYKDVLINVCSKYNKEMTFSLSLSLLVYPPLIISKIKGGTLRDKNCLLITSHRQIITVLLLIDNFLKQIK
jgi:hypothetical protein